MPGFCWEYFHLCSSEILVYKILSLHCVYAGSLSRGCSHACLAVASLFSVVLCNCWRSALQAVRARWSGIYPSGGSRKSWGIRCVVQGEDGVGVLLLILRCCSGMGFKVKVCLSLFYLFQFGYFLSRPMCRSHSTCFWISLRGNWSFCSYTFVASMGGREIRSFQYCLLGDISSLLVYFNCWKITSIHVI